MITFEQQVLLSKMSPQICNGKTQNGLLIDKKYIGKAIEYKMEL